MNTVKRLLSALVFYPILVLWFIPRQKYLSWKKAEFEYIYNPDPENPGEQIVEKKKRSSEERKALAKMFFDTEFQIALAGRNRSSKKERKAVYQEHLKAITSISQEDKLFKDLGIEDKDAIK